jgi:hypothetical protein
LPRLKPADFLTPQHSFFTAPFKTHSTTVPKPLPSKGCIENAPALGLPSFPQLPPPERSRYSTNS